MTQSYVLQNVSKTQLLDGSYDESATYNFLKTSERELQVTGHSVQLSMASFWVGVPETIGHFIHFCYGEADMYT